MLLKIQYFIREHSYNSSTQNIQKVVLDILSYPESTMSPPWPGQEKNFEM